MNGILKHPTKMSARHHQTKMMEPRVGEEGGWAGRYSRFYRHIGRDQHVFCFSNNILSDWVHRKILGISCIPKLHEIFSII